MHLLIRHKAQAHQIKEWVKKIIMGCVLFQSVVPIYLGNFRAECFFRLLSSNSKEKANLEGYSSEDWW